ncbi:AAA family ATPase [Microbacterium sp. P01]|uniref:AAA family ATPase n=1 Tax=Microbacterium sp. P01 TaxID=3366261 RepID=UPI0036713FC6
MSAGYTPALYADVAGLLTGDAPEPPRPTIGRRSDGSGLLYAGAVNVMFGPPESGKTLAASCIAADELFQGHSVLVLDLDHNGARATIARLRTLGVQVETLSDPARFRYAAPEDSDTLLRVIGEARVWVPGFVLLDSVGELLPMFGANSNDADDFTRVNRLTMAAMASHGAAVVAIDHEAKGAESRGYGSSGTAAKKRAVDGVMLRVAVREPFAPGRGGKAALSIAKDRHGGLRATSPAGEREPLAAVFQLIQSGEALDWRFWAASGDTADGESRDDPQTAADLMVLQSLDPVPTSVRDAREQLKARGYRWSNDRLAAAMRELRAASVPRSAGTVRNEERTECSAFPTPYRGEQEHVPDLPQIPTLDLNEFAQETAL